MNLTNLTVKIVITALFALFVIQFTGCTTFSEGTDRKFYVTANVPNVSLTMKTRSKEVTKTASSPGSPVQFDLSTRKDRGRIELTATEMQSGRSQTKTLDWINEHSAKMYGGNAIATAVTGVFGLVGFAVDIYTRSCKELEESMVTFDFLNYVPPVGVGVSGVSSVNPSYPVTSQQQASSAKKPCKPLGQPATAPQSADSQTRMIWGPR